MKNHVYAMRLAFTVCAAIVLSSASQADDRLRYVGTKGIDTNPCTPAAPCRTLQRGINVTPVGGELLILEAGYYGLSAKVTKSMTISGDDVSLSLMSIAIGGAGAVVNLRGLQLTFPGNDNKTNGITVQSAATVQWKTA